VQYVARQGVSWQDMIDSVEADLGQNLGLSNDYHQKILPNDTYQNREKQ
jgi:hypothetical protein